jgi:hypothetical protein
MPTQYVTIAKIGGPSGAAIIQLFEQWQASRVVEDESNCMDSTQWPRHTRDEMQQLADALRAHASQPPVIFWAEYVDMWSCGLLFTDIFSGTVVRACNVMSDNEELLCYRLPDENSLRTALERQLRRKPAKERDPQELRWYLLALLEACRAWEKIVDTSAIVVVRRVVGALIEDRDIHTSLESVPGWLQAVQRRRGNPGV